MRADRLIRKTYLKKHQVRPDGEITMYDLTQISEQVSDDAVFLDDIPIIPENDRKTLSILPDLFQTPDDILTWGASLIQESPVANMLWDNARKEGWFMTMTDLHSNGFHLDISEKMIFLDHFSLTPASLGRSAYFRHTFLITLIRALRDIWHENHHVPFENNFSPEDILMLERVRAADCDSVTILAAWELRGAGHAEIWRHLIGSAEGDMALIFTRYLERDPSSAFNGLALAYAFRQWYADETRVDGCDHETLESLDNLLLESHDHNPFGHTILTPEILESLSLLPDGMCYLAGCGDVIMQDPFFAGLRDDINQTHFFQIMYDMEVTMVNNVPFRDRSLAQKFFPQDDPISSL